MSSYAIVERRSSGSSATHWPTRRTRCARLPETVGIDTTEKGGPVAAPFSWFSEVSGLVARIAHRGYLLDPAGEVLQRPAKTYSEPVTTGFGGRGGFCACFGF
jgi:hypothetical protein